MHRISPNNPVRRRLIFEDDEDERDEDTSVQGIINTDSMSVRNKRRIILEENLKGQAKIDNSTNILYEMLRREQQEKVIKWNFDFAKEEALPGPYDWYMKKGEDWVHMEPKIDTKHFRYLNENTPYQVRDETAPPAKKRKSNIEGITSGPSVKRKIDFSRPYLADK